MLHQIWSQAHIGKFGHKNPPILMAEQEFDGDFEDACDYCFEENRFYDWEQCSLMGLLLYPSERKALIHERH